MSSRLTPPAVGGVPPATRPWFRWVRLCPGLLGAVAVAGYLFSVVAANVASAHWPPLVVGGLLVPAGTLFAGACLTVRDLVHDTAGLRGLTVGMVAGAGLSAALTAPPIAAASIVAFTASELIDSLIYAQLRERTRLGAVGASNAAALVVDSVLFVPLAFGSLTLLPGQIAGKAIATLLTLAALHLHELVARR